MNYTKTNWENDITPVSAENMNKIENQLKALTDAVYPVGAIYMSMNATSPATLFGGTWERIGVGRTLVSAGNDANAVVDENNYTGRGVNTAEADWFPVGETGGEFSHTLTITEIPAHHHPPYTAGDRILSYNYSGTGKSGVGERKVAAASSSNYKAPVVNNANVDWRGADITGNSGGGGGHNNMSTYLAVYMWKRTG